MATRGDLTEAKVLGAFLEAGLNVLVPWRSDLAYDLLVTADDVRSSACSASPAGSGDGCVEFNSRSTDHGAGQRDYRGRADVFGVYCPALEQVFVVPVDDGRPESDVAPAPARAQLPGPADAAGGGPHRRALGRRLLADLAA